MKKKLFGALSAGISAFALSSHAAPIETFADNEIVITGETDAVAETRPTTTESKSGAEIETTTNVLNAEDALRYFPNITVRKRHVGDTQAPITTRTSGVGASARSLIYADGVLVSALLGNNNSYGSPKWGIVQPASIAKIDVLYGPFSAAYAGNSIGAVVEIETRMPEKLEGQVDVAGSRQAFDQYETKSGFDAARISASIGDRFGPLSVRFGAQRTESDSQPLAYITVPRPASPSATGTVLTGAFADVNRAGAPIVVLGAGAFEHQVQDNQTLKLKWDFTPSTNVALTIVRFGNDTDASVQSYLRDSGGATIYSGGPFNVGGYSYSSIAASAFSNNVYRLDETQWMKSLAFTHSGGPLSWRVIASAYDYDQSEQRQPSTALPTASSGGAGSITRFDGTGWRTLDLKAIYRLDDIAHEISFGAHGDRYDLANNRFSTANWISGPVGALASAARGKTQTGALWAQDFWTINPALRLTTGLRWERWKAFDGLNYSLSPTLNVRQPEVDARKLSPKAALAWDFAPDWTARVSLGEAYRFPTVGELYQAITTGSTLTIPNPNLKPEQALSTEWALERRFAKGFARVGGIHLVAGAIAELRRAVGSFAKRTVKAARVFDGVGKNRAVGKAFAVERGSEGGNAPVHHVARCEHVGAGLCVDDAHFREHF